MNKYQLYHETQAQALQHMANVMLARGYEVTEYPDVDHVAYCTTNRYTFPVQAVALDGKSKRRATLVFVQLYRMESGKYELNFYTNV